MIRLRNLRRGRRLLGLAAASAAVSQVAGCLPDPQQLLEQIPGFVQDFARQVLAAYLL